jgi:hypothetical protein
VVQFFLREIEVKHLSLTARTPSCGHWLKAALAGLGLVWGAAAMAAPISYSSTVVTDVSLGGHKYHRALLTLNFVGDTNDLETFADPVAFTQLTKGRASLVIVDGDDRVEASFNPGQVFISIDSTNGGEGFSSLVGADHHLEPAYPLVIDGSGGSDDLVTYGTYSGHAWSCIGFPSFQANLTNTGSNCLNPEKFPLKTDHGDFVVYQKYEYYDTLNNGVLLDAFWGTLNKAVFTIAPAGHP